MRLDEKLTRLQAETDWSTHPLDVTPLTPADLSGLGIAPRTPPGARYYFERNSAISSPMLSYVRALRLQSFVGAFSYVNDGGYLRDRVLIGRYCSIGRRVTIGAGQHPIMGLSSSGSLKGQGSTPYSEEELEYVHQMRAAASFTIIESDVWVGDGVVIMPGVRIATGSVIAANAVIARDTEPYGIYAGLPARRIRQRFSDSVCERLLASQWWEYPHEILNRLPTANIFQFLDRFDTDAALADEPTYMLPAI